LPEADWDRRTALENRSRGRRTSKVSADATNDRPTHADAAGAVR